MRALLVDDGVHVREQFERAFEMLGRNIVIDSTPSLSIAERFLRHGRQYDVALVSLELGDASGLEAPVRLQAIRPDLVIVALLTEPNRDAALELIRLGLPEYLMKCDANASGIRQSIRLARERFERENTLQEAANTDVLTGLLNRRGLDKAISSQIEMTIETGTCAAMLAIDIDRFKSLNDEYGHSFGDAVLSEFGCRLRQSMREHDIAGRAGGDEFWIFCGGLRSPNDVPGMARTLRERLRRPFRIGATIVPIRFSMGIALVPQDASTLEDCVWKADQALYEAKRSGRNRCYLYGQCKLRSPLVMPGNPEAICEPGLRPGLRIVASEHSG
jgi:diguanylate cyclase (GGDEF)-like protein